MWCQLEKQLEQTPKTMMMISSLCSETMALAVLTLMKEFSGIQLTNIENDYFNFPVGFLYCTY